MLFAINRDLRSPAASLLNPVNTFCPAGVVPGLGTICLVLRSRTQAQILSAIVERVAIDMINGLARPGAHDHAVQVDTLGGALRQRPPRHVPTTISVTRRPAPADVSNESDIFRTDESNATAAQINFEVSKAHAAAPERRAAEGTERHRAGLAHMLRRASSSVIVMYEAAVKKPRLRQFDTACIERPVSFATSAVPPRALMTSDVV